MNLKQITTSDALKQRLERKEAERKARQVDDDTMSEVKLGIAFGWEALLSARYNDFGITEAEMNELLKAQRKIEARKLLDLSDMVFNAVFSAVRTEKPVEAYKQLSKPLRDEAHNE